MTTRTKVSIAVWVVILAGWYVWQRVNPADLEPIVIADGAVTVRNQTTQEWRSVRIWVNEHYSGGAQSIPPGGFVREPLSRFVASQGQTINVATTKIFSVVVLATAADGTRIRVPWGTPALH